MDDFIEVYENALAPADCERLIARFEASGEAVRGATGGGVDLKLKDSWDIRITGQRMRNLVMVFLVNTLERELRKTCRRRAVERRLWRGRGVRQRADEDRHDSCRQDRAFHLDCPPANDRVSQTATVMSTAVVAVPSASGVNNSANGAMAASKPRPTRCESG